jgi:hypothetical protein
MVPVTSPSSAAELESGMRERARIQTPQSRIFDYVAESVERDAQQATRLLEAWIGTSGEEA